MGEVPLNRQLIVRGRSEFAHLRNRGCSMIVSSGRTVGIVLVAVCLVACDGAPSAAAPVVQPEEMQQGATAAPATAPAAAPANPLAPGWLKLQGKAGPVKGRYACQDWDGYSIARVQANANYGGDVRRSTYFTSEFSITGEKATSTQMNCGARVEPSRSSLRMRTSIVRVLPSRFASAKAVR